MRRKFPSIGAHQDGMVLTYSHDGDNEERREKLEAMTESAVRINVIELESGKFDDFSGLAEEGIVYEEPRMTGEGQKVGSLSEVIHRGKATCIEAAAIDAALFRYDNGQRAFVALIPVKYRDKVKPGHFHAVVVLPSGQVIDSSNSLEGYQPAVGGKWWEKHGHCCHKCALRKECLGAAGGCNCKGKH